MKKKVGLQSARLGGFSKKEDLVWRTEKAEPDRQDLYEYKTDIKDRVELIPVINFISVTRSTLSDGLKFFLYIVDLRDSLEIYFPESAYTVFAQARASN